MHGQSYPGTPRRVEAGVVRANRFIEQRLRLDFHLVANPLPPFFVHEVAVARRIDLNVFHALARELRQLRFHDGDNVPQQRSVRVIDFVGDALFVGDGRKLRSARQGHLDRAGTMRLQIGQFVPGQRAHLPQPRRDDTRNAADGRVFGLACVPASRHGIAQVEAFYGVGEIAHEIATPQFTVGKDVEAQLLLFCQNACDVAVFQFVNALRVFASVAPRLEQFRRPQKAAHMIRPVLRCHLPSIQTRADALHL